MTIDRRWAGRSRLAGRRARGLIPGIALAALWGGAAPATVVAQLPATPTVEKEAPTAGGQEARVQVPVWPEGEWKFGGSMGLAGVEVQTFPAAFTLGAHAQYFPSGRVGVEGSLGFAPLGLLVGGLVVGGRAGVTVPLRTDSILVLPSAGVSVLAGASRHGFDSSPGLFYAGLATLHVGGLRLGVTLHWADLSNKPAWLVEVGVIRLPNRGHTPQ